MKIITSDFLSSYTKEEDCPADGRPCFAFIGRSNVGKSSLINMLTERKALAKVSGTPGKTQLINYFIINKEWYLVDLPGYGYAKVSKKMRSSLRDMIEGYLGRHKYLALAFVLIDANVEPKKVDIEFINILGELRVPFALVFTKIDKTKPQVLVRNTTAFFQELKKHWDALPPAFNSSSSHGDGREEILGYIGELIKEIGTEEVI